MTQPFNPMKNQRSKLFGLKALVVDFDAGSLEALASWLKQCGMDVITARDGVAGLNLFREHQPQVVLLEAMLPKMSGFELSKQIQIESQGKVPVIIVTGIYKDVRHKIEAIKIYGAAAFFTKPWKKEDLETCIASLTGPAVVPSTQEELLLNEYLEDFPELLGQKPVVPTAAATKAKPEPDSKPKGESKEVRSKKPSEGAEDVDKLLEKTLADLGFGPKKAVAPETKKPAPPPGETWLQEIKSKPAESKPVENKARPVSPQPKLTPEPLSRPAEILKPGAERPKKDAEISQAPDISKPKPETFKPLLEVQKPTATPSRTEVQPPPAAKGLEFIKGEPEVTPPVKQPLLSEKSKEKLEAEPAKPLAPPKTEEKPLSADIATEPGFTRYPASAPFLFTPSEEAKKRPSTTLIIGIMGIAALVVAAIFVFKPKKVSLPPANSQAMPASSLIEEPAPNLASRLEEQLAPAGTTRMKAIATEGEPQSLLPPIKKEAVRAEEETPPVLIVEPQPTPTTPLPPVKVAEKPSSQTQAAQQAGANQPQTLKPEETPALTMIKEGDLVPLAEVDIQPRAIRTVEPKYPPLAMQMGLEGAVLVNALISENGDVIRTEILRGIKNGASLEQAAEAAIRQWKFTPAVKSGVKVKVWKPVETRFRLKQ